MSPTDRPELVCICGSTRFAREMAEASLRLSLEGVVVLAPVAFEAAGDDAADEVLTDAQKAELGALHLRKVELADRVLIVNPGGYVGKSTRREIAHARSLGKPVTFTDPG